MQEIEVSFWLNLKKCKRRNGFDYTSVVYATYNQCFTNVTESCFFGKKRCLKLLFCYLCTIVSEIS